MTPYFASDDRKTLLRASAASWKGTRFRKWQRVKRHGVDCVQLCAAIYIECGHLDVFEPTGYTLDGGENDGPSLILDWLRGSSRFVEVDTTERVPGDILCFRMKVVAHHAGILLEDHGAFVHCAPFLEGGTRYNTLRDPYWSDLLTHIFRPVEVDA